MLVPVLASYLAGAVGTGYWCDQRAHNKGTTSGGMMLLMALPTAAEDLGSLADWCRSTKQLALCMLYARAGVDIYRIAVAQHEHTTNMLSLVAR